MIADHPRACAVAFGRDGRFPGRTGAGDRPEPYGQAVGVARNIARKRVMEMLLTGEMIDAPMALAWGLVNRVVAAAPVQTAAGVFRAVMPTGPSTPGTAGRSTATGARRCNVRG